MTMGQRIAEERKKLNLSQEALGEKLGVSRQAISKWESDGAVPDVDKLIGLSKLFGVTVGWLLGVEEEPRGGDSFTEEQLKMVEEIVKRYQPQMVQPEQKPRHRVLKAVAALAAVIIAYTAWSDLNQRLDWNAFQINGLNNSYNAIMSQLSSLGSRLDQLTEGEKLLNDYTAEAKAWADGTGADVTLTMSPKTWTEGDIAYVSVRLDGAEVGSFECTQDGTAWIAVAPLEAKNGYGYYFVLSHPDGTREQEWLYTQFEELEYMMLGEYYIWCDAKLWDNTLTIGEFTMDLKAPGVSRDEPFTIEQVNWIVTRNGNECAREEAVGGAYQGSTELSSSGIHRVEVTLPECSNGDVVMLSLEVTMSDGTVRTIDYMKFTMKLGCWYGEQLVY